MSLFHLKEIADRRALQKLSFGRKLVHPKVVRHLAGIAVSGVIIYGSAWMALHGATQQYVWHWFWDGTSWFGHGFGAIPALRHLEPLWDIFFPVAEEVAES